MINVPIITLKTDSIFPCPKGCSLSSGLLPTFKPTITKIFVIKSEKEFNPSAKSDILLNIFPENIFKKARIILIIIATFATKTIFFSCFKVSSRLFKIYPFSVRKNFCFSKKLFIFL